MTSPMELENELYAGLSETVQEALNRLGEPMTCTRGTRLIQKGTLPKGVIILKSGTAQTTVTVAGKQMSLGVASPGQVFGMHSVLTGSAPDTTVTCLEDCSVTIIHKDVFLEELKHHPELYIAVVKVLSAELASAQRLIRECARRLPGRSSRFAVLA